MEIWHFQWCAFVCHISIYIYHGLNMHVWLRLWINIHKNCNWSKKWVNYDKSSILQNYSGETGLKSTQYVFLQYQLWCMPNVYISVECKYQPLLQVLTSSSQQTSCVVTRPRDQSILECYLAPRHCFILFIGVDLIQYITQFNRNNCFVHPNSHEI